MGTRTQCPYCCEPIKSVAIKCRHCHADLTGDDVPAGRLDQAQAERSSRPRVGLGKVVRVGAFVALVLGAIALGTAAYVLYQTMKETVTEQGAERAKTEVAEGLVTERTVAIERTNEEIRRLAADAEAFNQAATDHSKARAAADASRKLHAEKTAETQKEAEAMVPRREELARELKRLANMTPVRSGRFHMGCGTGDFGREEKYCSSSDGPLHEVFMDGFFVDKTEVTQDDFKACVDAGTCTAPKAGGNCTWGETDKGSHPANCVDWYQASAFCKWAGKRLCTSAEWEKAARGSDQRFYPWGNGPVSCELAVVTDCDDKGPQSVGSRPLGASPYGALDMAGNVWEWVSDCYSYKYYRDSPRQNPKGPSCDGPFVVRGGSYNYRAKYTRTSARHYWYPDTNSAELGLRCCWSPTQ